MADDIVLGAKQLSNPNDAKVSQDTDKPAPLNYKDQMNIQGSDPAEISFDESNPSAEDSRFALAERATPREGNDPAMEKKAEDLVNDDAYWEAHEAKMREGLTHMIGDGGHQYVDGKGLTEAIQKGWKATVPMQAPDGSFWHVPMDKIHEAMKDGAQIRYSPKAPPVSKTPKYEQVPGMVSQGNIDLKKRPIVANPDGTYSTVRSIGVNVDGKEVLIPTVVNGKVVSNKEAIKHYKKTGEHLGVFDSPEASTAYAQKLHEDQAKQFNSKAKKLKGAASIMSQ